MSSLKQLNNEVVLQLKFLQNNIVEYTYPIMQYNSYLLAEGEWQVQYSVWLLQLATVG